MAKKEINLKQFKAIIKEEAVKLNKRIVLENERKMLISELKLLNEYGDGSSCHESLTMEDGIVDELFGIGGSTENKKKKLEQEFLKYAKAWKAKGAIRGLTQDMLDDLMTQAEKDGFEGAPGIDQNTKLMTYRPSSSIKYQGGIQGHAFGSGM